MSLDLDLVFPEFKFRVDKSSVQMVYEFEDFRLDAVHLMLYRGDEEISVPPKAVETLLAIIERRGAIVGKDDLMSVIWTDAIVDESNLALYLHILRKTLGNRKNGKPFIETLRRRGYRFNGDVKVHESPTDISTPVQRTVEDPNLEDADAAQSPNQRGRRVERRNNVLRLVDLQSDLEFNVAPAEPRPDKMTDVQPARSVSPTTAPRSRSMMTAAALIVLAIVAAYWSFGDRASTSAPITSIAVLPIRNESGNPEVEYLSDGMTESLINSVAQLPQLSVKARSTVFRYKGQQADPQRIASELSVQAVVEGRLVQRGEDLTLYLALVDGRDGNLIWGRQYDRQLSDLLTLQGEIGSDLSQQLRVRFSGVDERKLAKNYTQNVEAYQLYLRGRYHGLKRTLPETQKAISYFQQAIAIDPSYALAYVGLADAHFSSLAANVSPNEFFPQARAAAQKAIEIDDTLAAAHAELGFIIFWYDWDWGASENKLKRALELDPDSADTHLFYAHLLSNTGKHSEALVKVQRARELEPLNLRINALEGQFLIHAGRTDEALTRLQETLELDSNYFLARLYTTSAYIEKGMYSEAIREARRAREISGARSTYLEAFLGYALAKSGKEAEARSVLESLLKSSAERYVSGYHIALVYNGLGEHDEALAWLERAYAQRSPAMVFLKVEPKWNNLSSNRRFQDLLRRLALSS